MKVNNTLLQAVWCKNIRNTGHEKRLEKHCKPKLTKTQHNADLFKLAHGKIMGNDEVSVDSDNEKENSQKQQHEVWADSESNKRVIKFYCSA